jgi:hypothetical protein
MAERFAVVILKSHSAAFSRNTNRIIGLIDGKPNYINVYGNPQPLPIKEAAASYREGSETKNPIPKFM